jgi:hypothetical protein
MRTSVGLVREQHICRYHSVPLKPRLEDGPVFMSLGSGLQRNKRVVYRCPKKGCPFLACGEEQYHQNHEEKKCVSSLSREFA